MCWFPFSQCLIILFLIETISYLIQAGTESFEFGNVSLMTWPVCFDTEPIIQHLLPHLAQVPGLLPNLAQPLLPALFRDTGISIDQPVPLSLNLKHPGKCDGWFLVQPLHLSAELKGLPLVGRDQCPGGLYFRSQLGDLAGGAFWAVGLLETLELDELGLQQGQLVDVLVQVVCTHLGHDSVAQLLGVLPGLDEGVDDCLLALNTGLNVKFCIWQLNAVQLPCQLVAKGNNLHV